MRIIYLTIRQALTWWIRCA